MNETEALAQFIVDTRYERLPGDVVEAAKVAILDGVANVLAGSTQELADIIGEYTRLFGRDAGLQRSGVGIQDQRTGGGVCQWGVRARPGLRDTGIPTHPRDFFLPAFGAGVGRSAARFGADHH